MNIPTIPGPQPHYRLLLFRCMLVAVFCLCAESLPAADGSTDSSDYLDPARREVILAAGERIFNDDFVSAHYLADSLILGHPEDPIGHLFKAAAYLGEMTFAEEDVHNDRFHDLIDTVRVLAERRIKTGPPGVAAWMQLCLGHAAAYESLWESRFGSLVSAIKQGFKARSAYEKGLQYDSTLYDLYGGLGMYHYWKSTKAGLLRWLGIFKNDRARGIEELRLTIDSSRISQETARNALIWIWLNKKEYDSAVVVSREMYERFPEGTLFLWPLATALFEQENFQQAAETYRLLEERLRSQPGNYYNLVECHHQLYRCLDKLRRNEEARAIARGMLEYYDEIPKSTKRRQRSKIAFLKREAYR